MLLFHFPNKIKMRKSVWAWLSLCVLFIACEQKEYSIRSGDPIMYSKTVKKLNDIVLENNFPPMIAARNYVYANIAAYECIAAGDSSYQSLAGQIRHMPPMPEPAPGMRVLPNLSIYRIFCKHRRSRYLMPMATMTVSPSRANRSRWPSL